MRLTEEAERLVVRPFTPKPKDGRPMTQHVRTPPGHERFAFDHRRRGHNASCNSELVTTTGVSNSN